MTGERNVSQVPALRERESIVTLRNGSRMRVRPIRPDDAARLQALYARLSFDTVYHRFFAPKRTLPAALALELATLDHNRRLALVAAPDDGVDPPLIAVARYAVIPDGTDAAETAMVVEDAWQRLGVGTRLLHDLLQAAEARGIRTFRADVLATNQRMLRLLRRETNILRGRTSDGVAEIVFERPAARVAA